MCNTRTCRRLSVAASVTALVATFIALVPAYAQDKSVKAQVEYGPITVATSCGGGRRSWYLSVNSAGQAELTISGRAPQQFQISPDDWKAFRTSLSDERFFELADEYGEQVPDGTSRTLTVTAGNVTKTVRVHFLMNWVQNDRKRLVDPARALRLLMAVRGWISDAEVTDLRPYDQRVLDAAPKQ